jgi:hypothetical protein
MATTYTPSTLKPAEVAVALVEQAVMKHRTRIDMVFLKGVRLLASLTVH